MFFIFLCVVYINIYLCRIFSYLFISHFFIFIYIAFFYIYLYRVFVPVLLSYLLGPALIPSPGDFTGPPTAGAKRYVIGLPRQLAPVLIRPFKSSRRIKPRAPSPTDAVVREQKRPWVLTLTAPTSIKLRTCEIQ